MLAVLSQIGLHSRHNSPILWFWDLYSRITVYGWVVITHQDFEATDDNLAHCHPPATLPSEGSCRSCYIRRKNGIWKPQQKGIRNFILRIPSELEWTDLLDWGLTRWLLSKKGPVRWGECKKGEEETLWPNGVLITLDLKADNSDDFLYFNMKSGA